MNSSVKKNIKEIEKDKDYIIEEKKIEGITTIKEEKIEDIENLIKVILMNLIDEHKKHGQTLKSLIDILTNNIKDG